MNRVTEAKIALAKAECVERADKILALSKELWKSEGLNERIMEELRCWVSTGEDAIDAYKREVRIGQDEERRNRTT